MFFFIFDLECRMIVILQFLRRKKFAKYIVQFHPLIFNIKNSSYFIIYKLTVRWKPLPFYIKSVTR